MGRAAVPQPLARKSKSRTVLAPTRGKISNQNVAAGKRGGARVLTNAFPEQNGVRIRGGSELFATIGTAAVESLMTYKSGSTQKIFAADETKIFDISAVADPEVAPAAAVSSQTSGYYSSQAFGTTGGDYLYIVNGADNAQLYDGSSFTQITGVSTPAITGVSTDVLSQVWSYRNRLYFVEKDTLSAWYLPVDAVGGGATKLPLNGVFQKGGSLIFGASWSMADAGDGADDKVIFVSSEGELVAFEGTDPGNVDWNLIGRYDVTKPLGKNATMLAGGDLLIACQEGIVPVSQVLVKDTAALSLAAVTRYIEPDWRNHVSLRDSIPWQILKWPGYNMGIVTLPVVDGTTPAQCIVVNLETGAWADYTGWDTRSLALFNGQAYFGTSGGKILQCESGGTDNGAPYTSQITPLFDDMGSPGVTKHMTLGRAVFLASTDFTPQISVSVDYSVSFPAPPSVAVPSDSVAVWDTSNWDGALWSGAGAVEVSTKWQSLQGSGFALAPQVQITTSSSTAPDVTFEAMHVLFERGSVVA